MEKQNSCLTSTEIKSLMNLRRNLNLTIYQLITCLINISYHTEMAAIIILLLCFIQFIQFTAILLFNI